MQKKKISEPEWYKDAIIYELHVKSFYDSDNDGIGDFKGLTEKLDYLVQLGVNTIWLLPFYPSPLKDDGYDIADYYNIHQSYGTLKDFKTFLARAHKLGLKVITELVLNHTSNEHKWFQMARKSPPGSKMRNYYVWSDSADKYPGVRIIFQDFETSNWTWDPVANAYYWHRFYSHQPDLNFENPQLQEELIKTIDFWFNIGVDGLRLDAIPYLYEREGTNCENLPETHAFLKKIRAHVDKNHQDKMLLAEANQWAEDAVEYFGDGDECHMAFHFPLMPRIFMSLQVENSFPIIDILNNTPEIPQNCQWAIFLRNHDELTLEMVTDEERDYMYKYYARDPKAQINVGIRRRLAPLLENNRRKLELMHILLFTLPGTPVLYYGDEIRMGDNFHLGDRDGVRTPMQWSPDRNAGFSKANPHTLFLPPIIDPEYHYETLNVENHERNPFSLLWWLKRLISKRKELKALAHGDLKFLNTDNPKILAFTRTYNQQTVLIIANLSRHPQTDYIDLSEFDGLTPEEVFSKNKFPQIDNNKYILTPGPFDYYLFTLKDDSKFRNTHKRVITNIELSHEWDGTFTKELMDKFKNDALPVFLPSCYWYRDQKQTIQNIEIFENISFAGHRTRLLLLDLTFSDSSSSKYFLPVSFAMTDEEKLYVKEGNKSIIAIVQDNKKQSFLYQGIENENFRNLFLSLIVGKKKLKGTSGSFVGNYEKKSNKLVSCDDLPLNNETFNKDNRNSFIGYQNKVSLKIYRHLDEGISQDVELRKKLGGKFKHMPGFQGSIEYIPADGRPPINLAIMNEYYENFQNTWEYTLDFLARYYEKILSQELSHVPIGKEALFSRQIQFEIPDVMMSLMDGTYVEMIRLLGKRMAEFHKALVEDQHDIEFRPEPFTILHQKSKLQSYQTLMRKTFQNIRAYLKTHPESQADKSQLKHLKTCLENEENIGLKFKRFTEEKIEAVRTRIHGDFHLGDLLFTGNDFMFWNLEGRPDFSLSSRRIKASPLQDVVGIVRSFHHAAHAALDWKQTFRTEDKGLLKKWIWPFFVCTKETFLSSYLESTKGLPFIPESEEQLKILLDTFLMEKLLNDIDFELNYRPEWTNIPARGLMEVLKNTW